MLNLKNTLDGYLKNVEVIGNTVQDTNNLADIRSVGDKVGGQELYKIDVVSCGKNIYKHTRKTQTVNGVTYTFNDDGTIQANGTAVNYNAYLELYNSEEFPLIGTYTFSGTSGVNINGTYYNCPKTHNFTSSDFYRFYVTTGVGTTSNNLYKPQLEGGTQATSYEPYKEQKLEILSPVQLEKVGDVADRIICKDGVWGVDKKVDAEVKNNVLVNTRTNSEFISLPHDQQVKLRTFAGQTNIAFLTEIPGQIKAQVPKSLGAVVNTHTEQIEMLHNALKSVLAGDMYSLATILYPEDFIQNDNTEQDIMVIPE